ncbi:MAG TPA: asparagine synthase (glutamine-hydrolyzing), partial [Aeromicrobium sp.]|nr:asparagine synthase (glutamine-hydrolyzing) [Aeromicrobium sp.]
VTVCGFSGFLSPPGNPQEQAHVAQRMASTIVHRGPDDGGSWADETGRVALGFRRLSIIDLSPEGHQPMSSADGRYTIVFNGEIYNFENLRAELGNSGGPYRGHSDTEVLLRAVSQWGLEAAISRLWGMFAFALWDSVEQKLHLVRDRLGKKPLYYGWSGSHFLFGSELKALREHPSFTARIDRDALTSYLRFMYVPTPMSIYEGVFKLPPGSWLTVDPNNPGQTPEPVTYWDPAQVAKAGHDNPLELSDVEATGQLETLLNDATKIRSVADVPIGAFLSGGIDSSAVVASLQAQSSRPVSTFTIGFNNDQYDESKHAKEIAKHLGTNHTELLVTPDEARSVIPKLPSLYDEPFSDASQIPAFLVSQLARQHVTVALSGDGGDEVFAGYNRYVAGMRIWSKLNNVPQPIRRTVSRRMRGISPERWDRFGEKSDRLLPKRRRSLITGNNAHKLATVVDSTSIEDMYSRLVSTWDNAEDVVIGGRLPSSNSRLISSDLDPARQMMLLDVLTYLPDDILTKVDRASMGTSLEARTPLLDHRLIEFAWSLPLDQLIRDGESKWILRQVLERHVPRALFDRPKQGFGIPIDSWLRGPLREWATDMLAPDRLAREGYFDVNQVQQKLDDHLSGRRNVQYHLWSILVFESWLEAEMNEGRCLNEPT